MHAGLTRIFVAAHRQLNPGPTPPLEAEFYPFAGLNHTIRRRSGHITARVSDVLRDAPEDVLAALAAILIGRLDRRRVDAALRQCYREYVLREAVRERTRLTRNERARPARHDSTGHHVNLETLFNRLNRQFFRSALPKVQLAWSRTPSRRLLGRCDAGSRTIVISRFFDSPDIPDFVLDYVLFHEMLHLQHHPHAHGARLAVHAAEFQTALRRLPRHAAAQSWLNDNLDDFPHEAA